MAAVRARYAVCACLAVAAVASPARAAERHRFAIPAGPLGGALLAVGRQGGVDIGIADPAAAGRPSGGLSGRMSVPAALARLLRGTGYAAREVRPGSYLIAREAARPARRTSWSPPDAAPPLIDPDAPIIVTASKRGLALPAYPGSAIMVGLDGAGRDAAGDVSGLVARLPALQATAFGAGRDKLFVRGVVDSSFAGPTQATVGAYFGETRLIYSGADPDLRLVDMDHVEILEGPQGTLYGAGAIGGIVRLIPRAPDSRAVTGRAEGSVGLGGGGPSHDLAGMFNLPVARDVAAVRAVAYRAVDGGYIADPQRDRHDVNTTATSGGRLAARITPDARWTIDIGGLVQAIRAADLQYAVRELPPLAHDSALAQPYRDDFLMGALTVTRRSDDGANLVATAGLVDRHARLRYDATRDGGPPSAYDERSDIRMASGEVRLWRSLPSGSGWLIGAAAVQNRALTSRQLGPADRQRDITGVDNRTLDLALFGEGTLALSRALSITGGVRLTHARMDGQPVAARPQSPFIRGESQTRADPTLGFSLRVAPDLAWFGRYGRGFRTGGLAVAAGIGRVAVYRPDTIQVVETGLRFSGLLDGTLSGSVAVARAWWEQIQADLVGASGFPLTANIGDGRIGTIEAGLAWAPTGRLRFDLAGLLAHSALVHPAEPFRRAGGDRLPDTPGASGDLAMSWTPPLAAADPVRIGFDLRYRGRSHLGVGPLLGLDQKGYMAGNADLGFRRGAYAVTLRLENLANARGDRFAMGNPFRIQREDQYTPLRPRTIRLAAAVAFGRAE